MLSSVCSMVQAADPVLGFTQGLSVTFPRVAPSPRSRHPVPRVLWALPAISVTQTSRMAHGHFSLSSSLLPHPSLWGKWVRPLFPRVSSWNMLKVSGKVPVATEVPQSGGQPLLVC